MSTFEEIFYVNWNDNDHADTSHENDRCHTRLDDVGNFLTIVGGFYNKQSSYRTDLVYSNNLIFVFFNSNNKHLSVFFFRSFVDSGHSFHHSFDNFNEYG